MVSQETVLSANFPSQAEFGERQIQWNVFLRQVFLPLKVKSDFIHSRREVHSIH